jgi:hypothetical protein
MITVLKPWGEEYYEHVIVKLNKKYRHYASYFDKNEEGYFLIYSGHLETFQTRKELAELNIRSRRHTTIIPLEEENSLKNGLPYGMLKLNLRHIEYIKIGKKKIKLKDFFEDQND